MASGAAALTDEGIHVETGKNLVLVFISQLIAWKKYFVLLLWLKGPTNQAISKTKVVFIIPDTRLFIFLECITVNSREPSRFPSCGHGSPESSAGGLSLKHFLGVCSNQGIEHTSYSFEEGNGTPLQYSCLENPMDGGA